MINPAWPLRPLGDLFEIGAGKTMSAAARDGAVKTPFLRTSNVLWDEIDLETVDSMSIPEHELQGKLLSQGDLLVCEGGDIGRAAVWNGEVDVMSFQNHLHRLRPVADDVVPRFYVYFLQSGFTQLGIFEGAGNKTTIPNLSRNRLAGLEVPFPSNEEQQDVVRALARLRDAIKVHDRSTALTQDLKRTTMQTIFTRGLRGEALKESQVGTVPESWAIVPFVEFVRLKRGFDLPLSLRRDGRIDVYGSNGAIGRHDTAPPTLPIPGVVVGRSGSVGKVNLAVDPYWPLNTTLFAEDFCGNDPRFVFYFLGRFDFSSYGQGVSVPTLNRNSFAATLVPKPPLDEQRDVVRILSAIDRKIDLHRQKRAVLDDLFKALLHKLMTGEIRVADLELSALDATPVGALA